MSRRRKGESVVPEPEFRSYYGRPVLKPPVWKVPDVPAYLYLGGLAGAASVMAALADLTGRDELRRVGRIAASAGSVCSVLALIHDLHRPLRFLNMLRVIKPTSPLSVGSWILAPFSALAGAAAASEVTGLLPRGGRAAGLVAGLLAPAMTTYTAVLLANTATPGWHEVYRELPYVFAGSAVSSAGAVALLVVPPEHAEPARRMAMLGTVAELLAQRRLEANAGQVAEVYRRGRAGVALRLSRGLALAGFAGAVFGRRRGAAVVAGVWLSGAAIATRYGMFVAGRESARDPRYTVAVQRARLDSGDPAAH